MLAAAILPLNFRFQFFHILVITCRIDLTKFWDFLSVSPCQRNSDGGSSWGLLHGYLLFCLRTWELLHFFLTCLFQRLGVVIVLLDYALKS